MRSTAAKKSGTGAKRMRRSPKLPRATTSACKFVVLAEEQLFSHADLSPGPHQALPLVGFARNLPGQEDFDSAPQKISRSRILRAERLRLHAASPAIQARGKDARVVEHDQVVRSQQVGKVPELCIAQLFSAAIQMQQPRRRPVGQRFLGNEFVGK